MNNESDNILHHLLTHDHTEVDPSWVIEQAEKYPAFFFPAALLLKNNPGAVDEDTRLQLQQEIILSCPDRIALTDFVDPKHSGWDRFYPSSSGQPTDTVKTIDDFISTYGGASSPEEDALLERLLFNPAPADYFASTPEAYDTEHPLALPPELRPSDDTQSVDEIAPATDDSPADNPTHKNKPHHHSTPHVGSEDTLLRESLAKIFIKQHRYERAFEIISKLSLNYPEKSVYFADQLRFLQKLIINQRYLDKEQ